MTQIIALSLILFGVASSVLFYFSAMRQEKIDQRLKAVSTYIHSANEVSKKWQWKSNPSRSKKLLMLGYDKPGTETTYMVLRLGLMLIAAAIWYFSQSLNLGALSLAQCIAVAIVAGMIIDRYLDWRVEQVRQEIARVLPDALDLMVVCVSSGLTLEAAFRTVGEEMRSVSPALSREWTLTATEMSVMDSAQQALHNMDMRLELPDINNMVVTMAQALKFGTPLSQALSLIASDNRQYHLLELEEWVGKIPAKMSFPLIIFIMMPVVVLIVSPVVISLFSSLGQI